MRVRAVRTFAPGPAGDVRPWLRRGQDTNLAADRVHDRGGRPPSRGPSGPTRWRHSPGVVEQRHIRGGCADRRSRPSPRYARTSNQPPPRLGAGGTCHHRRRGVGRRVVRAHPERGRSRPRRHEHKRVHRLLPVPPSRRVTRPRDDEPSTPSPDRLGAEPRLGRTDPRQRRCRRRGGDTRSDTPP